MSIDEEKSHGEYLQEEKQRKDETYREEVIRAALKHGHESIVEGDYEKLGKIVCNRLYPSLELDLSNVYAYDEELDESQLHWDWQTLYEFQDSANNRQQWVRRPNELELVFRSLESAAVVEGIISAELDRTIPVRHAGTQIGVRWLPWMGTANDREELKHTGKAEFTLHNGGTRNGKSTALTTAVEADIAKGNLIIDVHDQSKAENVLYDIEEYDDDLRGVREELGMDVGFEGDYEPPELTIFAPMTEQFGERELPYDSEADEFKVKGFTIPASEIPRDAILTMVGQTNAQSKYVEQAYEQIDREIEDWTLQDLGERVYDIAREDVADRVWYSLQTLQNKGYVRDKESDYNLDWEDVFSGEGAVKSFTVSLMEDKTEKQIVLAYILRKIFDERDRLAREFELSNYPTATLVMRELQKLAPSQGRQTSAGSKRSEATSSSTGILQDICEDMGHLHMEIIADSQKFTSQLNADVRTHADRIVTFKGNYKPTMEALSSKLSRSKAKQVAHEVMSYDIGECAISHHWGVNWPIQMAPPRSCKMDSEAFDSGLVLRTERLEHEELRRVDIETQLPERFEFGEKPTHEGETGVERFIEDCIEVTKNNDDQAFKSNLWNAFNTHRYTVSGKDIDMSRDEFLDNLRQNLGLTAEEHNKKRKNPRTDKREYCYTEIKLNQKGIDLLDE